MSDKAEEKEIWKQYPEFDFIEVSNLGNVRIKDRHATRKDGGKQFVKGRVMRKELSNSGYLMVKFSVNGTKLKAFGFVMLMKTLLKKLERNLMMK